MVASIIQTVRGMKLRIDDHQSIKSRLNAHDFPNIGLLASWQVFRDAVFAEAPYPYPLHRPSLLAVHWLSLLIPPPRSATEMGGKQVLISIALVL